MQQAHKCPDCEERKQQDQANDEFSFAILVSLIPMLVFTFFGQAGLF